MNAHEGGEGEYHGGPQYADLSNAQVMDQLQQQNPNQMQYQDDEELQEEEESKLNQVFNFLNGFLNAHCFIMLQNSFSYMNHQTVF